MESADDITISSQALDMLRDATADTEYAGRLYLVGGALRDRLLNVPHGADLDLVLEGDALELARRLYADGLSTHYPVLYPRFGTAMIHIAVGVSGVNVELVTARTESYQADSRKPNVRSGTLREDIFRRDFTINTLAEDLHSRELVDITGMAISDLRAGIIRTPVEPQITFFDDPLRMLRAVRFAARFEFHIDEATWDAVCSEADRLRPPTIAYERIREEFTKIVMLPARRFRKGIELLLESGLLQRFLPEMARMDWTDTLAAVETLPDDAPIEVRLAVLWHRAGEATDNPPFGAGRKQRKASRADGGTASSSAALESAGATRRMMNRLKFSNDEVFNVVQLILQQSRLVQYRREWGDPAVRRLIRDTFEFLDPLFTLTRCIEGASNSPVVELDLRQLRARMESLSAAIGMESPLDGNEIMEVLQIDAGPALKTAKEFLLAAVIDEELQQTDKHAAREMLIDWWQRSAR